MPTACTACLFLPQTPFLFRALIFWSLQPYFEYILSLGPGSVDKYHKTESPDYYPNNPNLPMASCINPCISSPTLASSLSPHKLVWTNLPPLYPPCHLIRVGDLTPHRDKTLSSTVESSTRHTLAHPPFYHTNTPGWVFTHLSFPSPPTQTHLFRYPPRPWGLSRLHSTPFRSVSGTAQRLR